jgi:hypothetical protein
MAQWADAVGRDRPDVVLVSLAGQIVADYQVAGQWVHPCSPSYDTWFERQVVSGLSQLIAGGARVVVALPAPSFDLNFSQRTECIRAAELRATHLVRNAYALDFKRLVCPRGPCMTSIDGITLREDGMHYIGPAAELVVRWMAPRLQLISQVATATSR